MIEWSEAFGNAQIYLHRDDAEWVMRPAPCIQFWDGEYDAPSRAAFVSFGAAAISGRDCASLAGRRRSKGALLSGDIIQVVPDTRFVSFMWSYPNYIPLNALTVGASSMPLNRTSSTASTAPFRK